MEYSIALDWLAFTYKEMSNEAANWIQLRASAKNSMDCPATNGYKSAYRTAQGVVVMWNVDRTEMGYHVIISGSAIRAINEQQDVDCQALLGEVCDTGASITRLDLAQDAQNEQISLSSIYQSLERGSNEGTARTFSELRSPKGGHTVYIGSRQSEKFIRIYNKAAQSELPGELWYRFELETKGMVSRALAALLRENSNWSGAFEHIAKGMCDLPRNKEYSALFGKGVVPIGLPKLERHSDREKWIELQCTPAIAKHFVEFPDSKAIERLRALLDIIERQVKQ